MFLEKPLQALGMTEKQAKVYLAALELGYGSVQDIAQKAGLKRPTAYVIIDELVQKGFLSVGPGKRGSSYVAENPDNLKSKLEENKKSLDYALPFLKAMYSEEKSKPQVRIYEGAEAMRQIYFETIWKSKTEILFFSSVKKINEVLPDLLDHWLDHFKENKYQLNTRELINPDADSVKYGQRILKINPMAQVRVVSKDAKLFFSDADNAIFDDKIMLVSFKDKLFTTIIQSVVLADSMRALYELAWAQATPLDKFLESK